MSKALFHFFYLNFGFCVSLGWKRIVAIMTLPLVSKLFYIGTIKVIVTLRPGLTLMQFSWPWLVLFVVLNICCMDK